MNARTIQRFAPIALLSLAGAAAAPAAATGGTRVGSAPVSGAYVEVRTASVFAGACHYNGERVTEGRSAMLAWRIDGGRFDGIDLTGVRVVAVVASDENLVEATAARRTALAIDAASDEQAAAAAAWVKSRAGESLGPITTVRRMPVQFSQGAETFAVRADGFAAMSVRAMPDRACCSQPELVWYKPLTAITDRRVGYTESASCNAPQLQAKWERADENSAIYGTIAP